MQPRDDAVLCPSARCSDGAILLGIVNGDGTVGFLPERLLIDQEFVDAAHRGRTPEKRFRFSNRCVQGACRQWTGDRCGVIDRVMDFLGTTEPPADLPRCSIRTQCRWYGQNGPAACSACPLVITDLKVPEPEPV